MSAYNKGNRYVLSESIEGLESPFLDEELFSGQGEEGWAPRLGSLEAESPFLQLNLPAFDQEIIGVDERTVVERVFNIPNRWICAIDVLSDKPDEHSRGTGILIGPRYVLTARHSRDIRHYEEFVVSPARNGSNSNNPFGSFKAVGFCYPERYYIDIPVQHGRAAGTTARIPQDDDYMLIILKEDLASKTHPNMNGTLSYWGQNPAQAVIRALKPDAIHDKGIVVVGYPGDTCGTDRFSGSETEKKRKMNTCLRTRKDEWASKQWRGVGVLNTRTDNPSWLYHTADTYKGQSGAPVCLRIGKTLHLAGIHTAAESPYYNKGLLVTERMLRNLCVWMNTDAGYTIAKIRDGTLIVEPRHPIAVGSRESLANADDQIEEMSYEDLSDSGLNEDQEAREAEWSTEPFEPLSEEEDPEWASATEQWEAEDGEDWYESDGEFDDAWSEDSAAVTELQVSVSEAETGTTLGHMAFAHILLETWNPNTSAMVPGVVPATPSALTTPFFDAAKVGTNPDENLQQALTSLIDRKSAYKRAGKNIAISLVDLSGANKRSPRYAGFNDLLNFYGASVNKITGLLGVYQLLAEANELLKANPTISDAAGLESEFRSRWTGAGIAVQHHPRVTRILTVQPGKPASPATAAIHPELIARLRRISSGNQNGSTSIVLLKFPYLGSTLLAHGLYSPANRGGLWTSRAYGPINYLRQKFALSAWSTKDNPYPKTYVHNINAVSVAQFFTLAAQRRMVDQTTSEAVLRHLQEGRCTTSAIETTALAANGQVSAKCGIYKGWVHDAVHFKETGTLRELVVVILTKNSTFGIMKNLFDDLVALVP